MTRTLRKRAERTIYPQYHGINEPIPPRGKPLAHLILHGTRILQRIPGQDAEGGESSMSISEVRARKYLTTNER